jgi:hypothetical protein
MTTYLITNDPVAYRTYKLRLALHASEGTPEHAMAMLRYQQWIARNPTSYELGEVLDKAVVCTDQRR